MLSFKYHGHACVEIISENFRMITDPWFGHSFHFDVMAAYPPVQIPTAADLKGIDVIHISHIHQDHFCAKSLNLFERETPVLIANYKNKNFFRSIQNLGFKNIIETDENGILIGPARFFCYQAIPFDQSYDSLIVMEIANRKIILNNDCILSNERYSAMRDQFGSLDFGFLGYTTVSPYPVCYSLPNEFQEQELLRIKKKALTHVKALDSAFNFKKIFPYANGIRLCSENTFKFNRAFNDHNSFSMFADQILEEKVAFYIPGERWEDNETSDLNNKFFSCEDVEEFFKNNGSTQKAIASQTHTESDYRAFFNDYFNHFLSKNRLSYKIQVILSVDSTDQQKIYLCHYQNRTELEKSSSFDIRVHFSRAHIDQVIQKKETMASIYYAFQFHAEYNFVPEQIMQRIHRWF